MQLKTFHAMHDGVYSPKALADSNQYIVAYPITAASSLHR